MPRQVRIEYPGAHYHVMSRGNRRGPIFEDDADRMTFLRTLGEASGRAGWRVHAYVLMGNHYHLLLETPEANLVRGMTWFQTTYTVRYNVRHKVSGHLFGGRYKAVLVDPDGGNGEYFATLMDYIHLNPVRAGLVALDVGAESPPDVAGYRWSSLPEYGARPSLRPEFLETAGGFAAFWLKDGPRGRREFVERVADRAMAEARERCGLATIKGQGLQSTLRRGWCYGPASFKEHLLDLADGVLEQRKPRRDKAANYRGAEIRDHGERAAEEIVELGMAALGLSEGDLEVLRKGAPEKALIAAEVRSRTTVRAAWIAERLNMGTAANVTRACGALSESGALRRQRSRFAKQLTKISS